jgi:hypothetical protein
MVFRFVITGVYIGGFCAFCSLVTFFHLSHGWWRCKLRAFRRK